jgi:hypothetical protein
MTYDPKCEELAEHFLPSTTSRRTVQFLAERIQWFVENEIEFLIRHGSSPIPELKQ